MIQWFYWAVKILNQYKPTKTNMQGCRKCYIKLRKLSFTTIFLFKISQVWVFHEGNTIYIENIMK